MRQEYSTKELFPVRCFAFTASEHLTASALEACREIKYKKYNEPYGVGTSDEIQHLHQFRFLHEWFQQCVDTLHADYAWNCDRLVVNKSWANRSDAGTGHHHYAHRHPMSFLSGIFYLTEGAPTVFLDPNDRREWGQFALDGGPQDECRFYYHGGPGGLILFPSYVVHSSVPNDSEFDRYTIAFNTFPSGSVNSGAWDRSMAEVTVRGWSPSELGPLRLDDYARQ